MTRGWRNYISPLLLKCEKIFEILHLNSFIIFLKVETKEINYNGYTLSVRYFYFDTSELNFSLFFNNSKSKYPVLTCSLNSIEELPPGNYNQSHIQRKTNDIFPKDSFGAIFHEIIRLHKEDFFMIKNIYSTSIDIQLSKGYTLSDLGYRFWEKQTENKLAVWIEDEKRFKAILNN